MFDRRDFTPREPERAPAGQEIRRGRQLSGELARVLAEAAYIAGSEDALAAAQGVLRAIHAALGFEAGVLASWNPQTDTHQILARYGYDESTVASLEIRDAEGRQTVVAADAFEDSVSLDMVAADGQYVGLIAFSAIRRGAIGGESRVILSSLAAAVAPAFDLRRHRRLTAVVSDDWRATVVDRRGGNWPVADVSHCWSVITGALDSSLAAFLEAPPSTGTRGLVVIEEKCFEIKLEAVADPLSPGEIAALVSERNSELPYGLSVREFDILNALARGHSNDRIAVDRVISVRTVTSHVGRILRKMGCSSRAAAALRAVREGRLRLGVDLPVSE